MKIAKTKIEFDSIINKIKNKSKKTISFVPTMGNLHQGHIRLIENATKYADIVVVSIFVNPIQFGKNEDLNEYPRTIDRDIEQLKNHKIDILFLPDAKDIYPDGNPSTQIINLKLSNIHCGKSRTSHFNGVCTVVNILFNIIKPTVALFGQKDYQQLLIIKKMVKDLHIPIKIICVETVRNANGLALSSRNQYLNVDHIKVAPILFQKLNSIKESIHSGSSNYSELCKKVVDDLRQYQFEFEYLCLCDLFDLSIIDDKKGSKNSILMAAAKLGKTRLIDNLIVDI
tara:strand:+ start:780 stop:1634 length:855 start_codon:yes stop_codon:yes gene_type:complete